MHALLLTAVFWAVLESDLQRADDCGGWRGVHCMGKVAVFLHFWSSREMCWCMFGFTLLAKEWHQNRRHAHKRHSLVTCMPVKHIIGEHAQAVHHVGGEHAQAVHHVGGEHAQAVHHVGGEHAQAVHHVGAPV